MGTAPKSFLTRSRPSHHSPNLPTQLNRWLSAAIIATMMAISTIVVAAELPQPAPETPIHSKPPESLQISQRIRRKDIWQAVQQQLPDLPLENQYVSSTTGEISEGNTLVQRMIEYHSFRQGRSPRSRFDWKLTLADYLGLNEVMLASTYPGIAQLTTNPMAGDRAAIRAMDRQQRQQLINTLVSLYDPSIPASFFNPATPAEAAPSPAPVPTAPTVEAAPARPSSPPPLAEPGAADLLRPRT